ncbi:hypothetical protein [Actinomycetospora chibensis]|uniref:Uncharacterized protein n=1 Tax=Actinomycetospora chibensis TaxID=663606 RepID=A0ABV9RER5_9PSEU|nr:hypothetical protein [Actinomycetospora chibensis]MDD7925092.1 hypothetical protein [Actinomycetospora chibensis]
MATSAVARRIPGDDPFAVDPALDLLHPVPAGVPGWNETAYVHVWNPDAGVGVFVHLGRCPDDLTLWWAQTVALLPDGRLVVDRSFGRAHDDRGPATGTVSLRCVEPRQRWTLRVDGAGEPTTTAETARGLAGAGPAVSLALEVELTALAPVWDLHAAAGVTDLGWAAVHHNEGFRSTGWMRTGGHTWALDGVAHRDHSSGPRDISGLGGFTFLLAVFPDAPRVVNALRTVDRSGVAGSALTGSLDGRGVDIGTGLDAPGLDDLASLAPRTGTVTRVGSEGPEDLHLEVLHGYVLSMLDPNENLIGAAVDAPGDPLLVTQSTVRVVDDDGAVGYGVFERDLRRSLLAGQ